MPLEAKFDPYLDVLAKPRSGMRVDDIAVEYQRKIAAANAAVDLLRNDPKRRALMQDNDATVRFTQGLGDAVAGDYTPSSKEVRVSINNNPGSMRDTLHHELTHNLQHQPGPKSYASNPLSTLDLGRAFNNSNQMVGFGETPAGFNKAISDNGMGYGMGEPGAWMVAGLAGGKPNEQVQKVIDQYPILSEMFAQQASQPNRPMPRHLKHEAEYSMSEKALNKVFGYQPEIELDQRVRAAAMLAALRAQGRK